MAQRLIKTNYLKLNANDTLAVAKSVFLLQSNIVTARANTTVSSLLLEYNSDGMFNTRLDYLHVDAVSTGYNGTALVASVTKIDGAAITAENITFPLDNIRMIEPDPNGGAGARITYVKRIEAGQPIFAYADTATAYASIHTGIS